MQIGNNRASYGWVAIWLHWVVAAVVITLYFIGDQSAEAPTRAARLALRGTHVSIGALAFVLLAWRVFWSLTQPKPVKLTPGKWQGLLANLVQYLFLAMIAVQIITGPLLVWSTGHPIRVFDWFAIPGPFATRAPDLHEGLETIHKYSAKLFWPLVILHLLGTAKSLLIDRDGAVRRMLWVKRGA